MQKFKLLLLFTYLITHCYGQVNLVPNPSFNFTISDSCGLFDPFSDSLNKPWHKLALTNAIGAAPGMHTCTQDYAHHLPDHFDGFEFPHSGNSCIYLFTYNTGLGLGRSLTWIRLLQKLKKNKNYCTTGYLSMADSSYIACNDFGFYFSTDSINENNIDISTQNIFPQVENNPVTNPLTQRIGWTEVKGIFKANGTEQYLTIGNFKSQAITDTTILPNWTVNTWYGYSFYLLDDVSVIEVRALTTNNNDTTICTTGNISKVLSIYPDFNNIMWSTGDTAHSITITQAGKYWVTATNACGTITDTFTIKVVNPNDCTFNLGNDTLYCYNFVKQLSINNTNLYNYQWSNGATSNATAINEPGTYWATAQSACGLQTDTIVISQVSLPNNIIHQNDTTIYVGDTLLINALEGFTQYNWSTGANTQNIKVHSSKIKNQKYVLSAFTVDGCVVYDTVIVTFKIKEELPIIVPNPQFIGKGNSFVILNLPAGSSVALYNALGQIIFAENNYTPNTSLPFGEGRGGAYFYKIVLADGRVINGKLVIVDK